MEIGGFLSWLDGELIEAESCNISISNNNIFVITGDHGIGKSAMAACLRETAKLDNIALFHSTQSDVFIEMVDKLVTDSSSLFNLMFAHMS